MNNNYIKKIITVGVCSAVITITPLCGAYQTNNKMICYAATKNEENSSFKKGWTKTALNVRKKPSKKSKVLDVLSFNSKVKIVEENKEWLKIKYKNKYAYVYKKYISKKKIDYIIYDVPEYSGYKSWMPYTAITSTSSPQYLLQSEYAYTGTYGIRQVDGRYCVAIGSYFTENIGQYFDLILENGTIIPCILADQKADEDTDNDNIFTSWNGCATEFIVDTDSLKYEAKRDGDISSCCDEWNSAVAEIKVYKKNTFK